MSIIQWILNGGGVPKRLFCAITGAEFGSCCYTELITASTAGQVMEKLCTSFGDCSLFPV